MAEEIIAPSLSAAPNGAPSPEESKDLPQPQGSTAPAQPPPTLVDNAMDTNTSPTIVTTVPAPVVSTTGPVPLDSPLRTVPIHPSLPSVKVPTTSKTTEPNTNPVTLQPFTEAELAKYGFEKLRAQIVGAAGKDSSRNRERLLGEKEKHEIERMREETAMVLKAKMEERETRIREVEREKEEKEKIREVERKVFRKKLGAKDV
ncbi:uncharacterized protein Z518_07908 [Rhinocladiella mackenziei CBS 650.93]|uniref:Uncharacterized protein n=1 Tax=Rhinocladiella mackenziei CBS 650.93 TaxID=1442369 RepID=A0A0D2I7Z4_9EURO|nr:uncharacterized protein Z518_07908 [Rhinocladiella mackenziei CBS 650.93]KIX01969.1 hypothetical protein Z518_07908 [Rhinocladiella mackenziei CBS 650.93]